MKRVFVGWALFVFLTWATTVAFMELKMKDDKTIMLTYGLSLIPPILLVLHGTWRFSKARCWSAAIGIVLAAVQGVAMLILALAWLATVAIMFSSYK